MGLLIVGWLGLVSAPTTIEPGPDRHLAWRNLGQVPGPYACGMATPGGDDLLELEVGAIAGGGGCVARAPDGKVVFVRHSLPGERVRARITASTSSYLRADAVEILVASPDRVEPPCPHAGPGRCGGCDFQHVALAAQRRLKGARVDRAVAPDRRRGAGRRGRGRERRARRARVADKGPPRRRPERAGGLPAAPVPSGRARRRVPGGDARRHGDGRAGGPLARDGRGGDRHGHGGGRGGGVGPPNGRATPPLPSVDAGVVVRGKVRRDPGAVHMRVGVQTYRVSAGVFWQAHRGAAAALSDAVLDAVGDCDGASVADLYSGAGLFAVALAQRRRPERLGARRGARPTRRCGRAAQRGRPPAPLGGRGGGDAGAGRRVASAALDRRARPGPRGCGHRRHARARELGAHASSGGLRLVRRGLVRPRRPGPARSRAGR